MLLILEWLGEQGVGASIRVDAERTHARAGRGGHRRPGRAGRDPRQRWSGHAPFTVAYHLG
ncbi:hypothetical protein DDE74_39500 [Streptomyces lydicus]|uniref:Uncharacterized protein n=1 Tax=Streptomyces lydicus TaxID=47763 RepID=A0A3S9YM91_9ACTN|nr:hypothetical protein DDE74_39500 [Streptomyces lydicus]